MDKENRPQNPGGREPAFRELPLIKSGEKNTKNLVIIILKECHPLSVQEIFDNLRDNFEPKITYQAARKAVLTLAKQGIVIEKVKAKYELDRTWISALNEFSHDLAVDYDPDKPIHLADLKEGETKAVTFRTVMITPYYWFLNEVYKVAKQQRRKSKFVAYFYGIWPITVVDKEEFYKLVEIFKKNTPYVLINKTNNTFSLELIKLWKNNFGGKYIRRIDLGKEDIIMVDEFVIKKIDTQSTLDKYIETLINVKPGHLGKLYKMLFSRKAPLTFVITRNKKLANELKKEYLKKYFRVND
ncbi:MAG: hypothetical protein WCX64_04850 [Candidatus Micrarchaeia archaeon]